MSSTTPTTTTPAIPVKQLIDTSLSIADAMKTREFRWEFARLIGKNKWESLLIIVCMGFLIPAMSILLGRWIVAYLPMTLLSIDYRLCLHTIGIVGFAALILLSRKGRSRTRWQALYNLGYPICTTCGYDVRGQIEPRCPECSTPIVPKQAFDPQQGSLADALKTPEYFQEYRRIIRSRRLTIIAFAFLLGAIFGIIFGIVVIALKYIWKFTMTYEPVMAISAIAGLMGLYFSIRIMKRWQRQALNNVGFAICIKCGYDLRRWVETLRNNPEPRCPLCNAVNAQVLKLPLPIEPPTESN
ncbi:MAG: hypothetical protein FWC56_00480 [Phycisphaerae bacterium]|nr:hypothetical protein [Phycisphaerae bacterium]